MHISAIQGQLVNSTKGVQAAKKSNNINTTKDLTSDGFSKRTVKETVSFKGFKNLVISAIKGGTKQGLICAGIGVLATFMNVGLAIPDILGIGGVGLIVGTVGGAIDGAKK